LRARIQSHQKGNVYQELLQRSEHLKHNLSGSATIKKKIAVIMGGYSFERHISMESGRNIYEKLSSSPDFEPIPVFLAGNSQSYRLFHLPLNMMLKDNADDIRDKILNYNENKALNIIQTESETITKEYLRNRPVFKPEEISLETLSQICEGVFIALHGRPGEDGTIQEDLAKWGLYHNGSLSHSASITINKFETNRKLREKGFLVANHAIVLKSDWQTKGSRCLCRADRQSTRGRAWGSLTRRQPGNRMVAAAWAAMPSPRPVNPSRSVVVAFTETEATSIPANSAMRARMASAWGSIFVLSQISVTST
jgi:D-alanine-D-alanine ligase